jgi:hypothetical protein
MFGSSLPPVVAGGITSYLRYICFLAYSGIQNILCPVFYFVFRHLVYSILPVSLDSPFFIAHSVFSNIYLTGQFQSSAVVNALRDLLRNKSSNVRAVAAVSLVKSGDKDPSTVDNLMKCLNDKDRLVREAGCLALGQLQSKKAVPKLLHLWYVLYKMSLIC